MNDFYYLLSRYLPMFLDGMRTTAAVSVFGFMLAFGIGLSGAAARQSNSRILTTVAAGYVEIIRNTPMLLQVFIIYFGLPSVALKFSNYQAAIIALGISGGGYLIEIFRSGFAAIPRGQREAASTLGLSSADTYFSVLLPQAMRIVYPPTVGQFLQMVLGSSLLSVIGLTEITGQAQVINEETFMSMPTFIIALFAYLVLTNAISLCATIAGRFLFKPPLHVVQGQMKSPRNFLRRVKG
ncbi:MULTISPECIES: amino acid ABC transporter permease [unclassified Mesorhizobium]|uniref:amino acid ABC transporter permease n=1 Tax=unclassified Mesorhizobium TaxID=325217 RepID=UPI000FD6D1B9|nr:MULTISPECIES: amino acid ABC transporter permease [unclassified Mesorhizobium]TGT71892.1 amino acid ABC transporter permease [Mesorhizobium sp. M2E.F.Ca.ET.166.01.1.1]TGV99393.1 amino acid ABC transporter permease [Mesorhizobium sp. M2E.F.Ca.ET.154.01.1.1]